MRTPDVKIATPLKDAGSNFDPLRVVPLSPAGRTRNLVARVERGLFKAGPRVRNPLPSSAESPANLTPLLEGRFAGRAPATRLAARSRVLAPSRRR